jgi:hypothetical protein
MFVIIIRFYFLEMVGSNPTSSYKTYHNFRSMQTKSLLVLQAPSGIQTHHFREVRSNYYHYSLLCNVLKTRFKHFLFPLAFQLISQTL